MTYTMRKLIAQVSDEDGREYGIEFKFDPHIDRVSVAHSDDIDVDLEQAKTGSQMIASGITRKVGGFGSRKGWFEPSDAPMPFF